jgi:hypothetical protein
MPLYSPTTLTVITENVSAVGAQIEALRVVEQNTVWKIEPFRGFLGVSNDRHFISEDLTDESICALA